jgi:phosphatidylglycerol lysyltransferase
MDYLFLQLIRYASAQGFKRFNLGMAPLSGLSREPLSSTWSKLGGLIYAHGERLYGFAGLRAFKAKFSPRWEPLYIGLSNNSSTLRALTDLIAVVDG